MLLVTTTAVLAWWITGPRSTAYRFTHLVQSKQHHNAADMFVVEGTAAMLTNWDVQQEATAWVPNLSWSEKIRGILRGRKRVELAVMYTMPDKTEVPGLFPLEASHRGIHALPAPLDHNFRSSDTVID